MHTQVAIIGAGVAGLNAARILAASGASVGVFEARERAGGRVLTVDRSGGPAHDGYDLGPSWFWPRLQPAMAELIAELHLASFPQNSEGDVVFERMSREPAQRYTAPKGPSETMRIASGSAALVRALADLVPPESIHTNSPVIGLELRSTGVRLRFRDGAGAGGLADAGYVVAALPPRLLAATMSFSPAVPTAPADLWRRTPTWMASQAKFFAFYDSPFWLDSGLSGTAQSMVGPMLEIHDATTNSGDAALFGFVGVGVVERTAIGETALTDACLKQLGRIFGPEALAPTATVLKDWASDPLTATADDSISTGHPVFESPWVRGPWADRLVLAGSETSPHEAGYLAGAVEASTLAATEILRRLQQGDLA